MKTLTVKARFIIPNVLKCIVILAALVAALISNTTASTFFSNVLLVFVCMLALYSSYIVYALKKGKYEYEDECDQQLIGRAAVRAIYYYEVVAAALGVITILLVNKGLFNARFAMLLVLLCCYLPTMIKDFLYLYYSSHE